MPEIELGRRGGPFYQESYNKDAIKCYTEHKLNIQSIIPIKSTWMIKTSGDVEKPMLASGYWGRLQGQDSVGFGV